MPSVVSFPDFGNEEQLLSRGYRFVAGVDEAGRGPLAGPVVAAAVIFAGAPPESLTGLADSKQLTARQREVFYDQILADALATSVAQIDAEEIDRLNILQASLKAMARAIEWLRPPPAAVLIDGNQSPTAYFSATPPYIETLVRGDCRSVSVAAASTVAKVTRDRIMIQYDGQYPEYGFARHKGYPSPEHRRAIKAHGVTPLHRRTFRGVREHCERR